MFGFFFGFYPQKNPNKVRVFLCGTSSTKVLFHSETYLMTIASMSAMTVRNYLFVIK